MSDAMAMVSAILLKECSNDPAFVPKRAFHGTFKAMATVKSRLGRGTPGPLAEALEVVDFLPFEERLEGALGIIQSRRHLCSLH